MPWFTQHGGDLWDDKDFFWSRTFEFVSVPFNNICRTCFLSSCKFSCEQLWKKIFNIQTRECKKISMIQIRLLARSNAPQLRFTCFPSENSCDLLVSSTQMLPVSQDKATFYGASQLRTKAMVWRRKLVALTVSGVKLLLEQLLYAKPHKTATRVLHFCQWIASTPAELQ